MIGETIGNYEITARIGAGGMGEVYRARDTKLGRDVAIKALPDAFAADPERLARFEREAKLLAGLNHANIGAIYGIEESGDARFLVLELIEGEDLSVRLMRGALSVEDALDVGAQIAEALEAAHEQGVIHRDLKPANVIIRPDGQVKVLDFGLAKALESGGTDSAPNLSHSPTVMASSPTVAGVILGTAAYMSPEQARGKPVDKRSDVFAFGAVFFEMLTGRQLFTGETVSDILAAVLRAETPLDDLPPGTPAALRRLIARCLEKDPRARLRDIGEARITIDGIKAGKLDEPVALRERPGAIRTYGGWITAVGIAVAALVVTRLADTTQERTLPLRKSIMMFSPDDPAIGSAFDPAISPDGRYLAYVSNGQLWVRDLTKTDARLVSDETGVMEPFWSPDSEWLAYGINSNLHRIRRDGGEISPITTLPSGIQIGAAASAEWGADGNIMIGPSTAGIYRVSAQGGNAEHVLPPAEGETDFHEICALPEGKGWVAVVHRNEGLGNLDIINADLTRVELLRIEDNVGHPTYSPSGHILFTRGGTNPGVWAFPFSVQSLERTGEPFLVAPDGREPSVSNDGTLVYTRGTRTREVQLVSVDRAGNVIAEIGLPTNTARPFPELSPDGTSIVLACNFGDGRELYLYDVATGNRRRLTFNELREDIAVWHPTRNEILFYETNAYTTNVLSLDGTGSEKTYQNCIMCDYTPDGAQLVCAKQEAGVWNWDIYVVPIDGDGTEATRLVSTDGTDWWPRISPGGNYLAYVSNETGRDEVFVTTFPNPTTRWQISTEGGEWPRWRDDGQELLFTTRTAMMSVDVSTENGFSVGAPKKLFDRPVVNWSSRWADGWDVTADGQTFVMHRRSETESIMEPAMVIVQNWFREFEESSRP